MSSKQLGVLILDKEDWLQEENGPGEGQGIISDNFFDRGCSKVKIYLYPHKGWGSGSGRGDGKGLGSGLERIYGRIRHPEE